MENKKMKKNGQKETDRETQELGESNKVIVGLKF